MENGLLKGLTDLIVTHRKGRNLKAKIQGFVEKTCKVIKNRRIEWANEIE